MTSQYKTEQENFWAGEFGDQYIERNQGQQIIAANLALFSRVIERTAEVKSAIEFGANIGLNLEALRLLRPGVELSAIEINQKAAEALEKRGGVKVYARSILDFQPDYQRDLVLIKGVLIHLNPDCLPQVYDLLHRTSKRYICIAEYYNPSPVEILYRGNTGKLFKRDFAGEMLDRFPGLRLLDYGFMYRRDANFAQDDITWFLLEKSGA
ncbi:MAG TPA: pseudaminic acid biosynthesis-associated methylase [Paucimonas sp.]|nr:pseudaminic acid biosynthesis-associated methylase [Paucimonas sp.]